MGIWRFHRRSLIRDPFYNSSKHKWFIFNVDGVNRDPSRTHRLLRSYARHQGAQASYGTIKDDLTANESDTFDENTIASYINALKKIFVIEDSEAWNPNLKSKSAIRTSDTRYFTDPSIATAALGLGPTDLINDLNTFGMVLTAVGSYAYRREDGVYVVPIGCLKN